MKKSSTLSRQRIALFIFCVLAVSFQSCNEPKAKETTADKNESTTATTEISTTERNIQVIDSLYNGFSTGDMPAVLGLMHPEIVWNEAESNSLADGNPYIGPDAVLEGVFARVGASHEYFALKDIEIYGMDDNMVLATLRYDGKVKETGKAYNAQAAHLWTLNEEGEIIAFQQYVDTKKLADAEM